MIRSELCRAEAELRLSCQMPIHDKRNLADIVIDNQCAVEVTEIKVTEVVQHLLELEKIHKH
jgi:dephospho-CoA kinase